MGRERPCHRKSVGAYPLPFDSCFIEDAGFLIPSQGDIRLSLFSRKNDRKTKNRRRHVICWEPNVMN